MKNDTICIRHEGTLYTVAFKDVNGNRFPQTLYKRVIINEGEPWETYTNKAMWHHSRPIPKTGRVAEVLGIFQTNRIQEKITSIQKYRNSLTS